MKPSFILHKDSLCVLEDLTNEQRGELFYAIYCYQIGEEIELKPIIKIAFSQFKNQFIRDEEKFIKTVEARKQAGSKGGKQTQANGSKTSKPKQVKANQAVKDSVSVKESDNDKESVSVNKNNTSAVLTTASPSFIIAENLLWNIHNTNPTFKKPNLMSWAKDIDKAIRLDGRTVEQLRDCIDWIYSKQGEFWQKNILSGKKLREKFDTMNMQKVSNPTKQQTQSFKQQDAQKTDDALDTFLKAREGGFDLRNVNSDVQDVEVIEK